MTRAVPEPPSIRQCIPRAGPTPRRSSQEGEPGGRCASVFLAVCLPTAFLLIAVRGAGDGGKRPSHAEFAVHHLRTQAGAHRMRAEVGRVTRSPSTRRDGGCSSPPTTRSPMGTRVGYDNLFGDRWLGYAGGSAGGLAVLRPGHNDSLARTPALDLDAPDRWIRRALNPSRSTLSEQL